MFFLILVLIVIIWFIYKNISPFLPETERQKSKRIAAEREYANMLAKKNQRISENHKKKEEYFNWLNENYSASKVFSPSEYKFNVLDWNEYEKHIVSVDEEKKVVIIARREINFKDIIGCELSSSSTHITTSSSNDDDLIASSITNSDYYINTKTYSTTNGIEIHIADISAPRIFIGSYFLGPGIIKEIHSTMLAIIAMNKNVL
ncbi:MAG: hypothetical protein E7521_07760 [Ruminococcaceae bacterium]|nr:hypothetical protein [Oscillospiraceae bacterium]